MIIEHQPFTVDDYLPKELKTITNPQTALPAIAKDLVLMSLIEDAVSGVPTRHDLYRKDAHELRLKPESVHLVVTSPPYWTLKDYRDIEGQLGHLADYEEFLKQLDRVWRRCFKALVPSGRLVCVVGDVCLSRRKNKGRHTVVPLHASIQERSKCGFDAIDLRGRSGLHSCGNAPQHVQQDTRRPAGQS